MSRVALVCPGRGSYTEASLGSLPEGDPLVREAEELRRAYELEPLLALDGARKFEPARHLRAANASALIYVVGMLDARRVSSEASVACVLGNSLGWYTALAAAGALSFADGFALVQEMALLQEQGEPGGQVLYPLIGDDWRPLPELVASVEAVLREHAGEVFPSIRLGGYTVLAGSERGVTTLLRTLEKRTLGKTAYPFRLAQHGPYHTPLASSVAERARERLTRLSFRAPGAALVDGRGVRWSPWSSDAEALRDYTLGTQIDTPFDFTSSVLVALREHAPDALVLLGPGNSLGGPCGQILVAEGWRGIRSRADFDRAQESDRAPVRSLRR